MPIYKERKKDCKYYIEKSLRDMGFTVNDNIQSEMSEGECAVVYTQFDNNIDTQESYWDTVWCKIVFCIHDNNEIPYKIVKILRKVTNDVEDSQAPNCSSFYFGETDVIPLGTTNRVEMNCRYSFEVDWEDPNSEIRN